MTQQTLPLDLPRRNALGRDSFFVSPSNAAALAMIENSDSWAEGRLVLTGPPGSGKSHLAQVWAAQSGARILSAHDLTQADVPGLVTGSLCLEDIEAIAGQAALETALFHVINLARANRVPLVLTGRMAPGHWGLHLPDLSSRVLASAHVRLEPPDDALLGAVLAKLFADRHIVPAATVIPFLVARMPRDFVAAGQVVAEIDALALGTRGGATRDKAQAALARLGARATPDRS